mmetsp:Transcript_68008/g.172096  ORF Transcript_68008/g.172096 Transcript_68008/m.172096 type:complete len:987 (-) Transcript_68008:87-3047(-)
MVLGEAAAAAVGTTGVTAAGMFSYNRENFMFDREQRQKQEIQTLNMRLNQSDVWREDVRDMVGLTEKKMDVYMVVTALHVGFNLALFTEGRFEMGTPQWLVWLYGLALTGAFMFQLLSLWLAMHASVVAQGSSVRLLTQFVRPALPSWEQVEAMRTYAAAFEGVTTASMLRVPILQTVSEGFSGGPGGHAKRSDACPSREAADPWGLERRGDDIYELQRNPLPNLRHAKLVKEAARQWQAYDAFARASMTLGTILQLHALSYYIIGYVLVMDGSPWAAWSSVACFLGAASMLMRLDVSMTSCEDIVAQILLFGGPTLACVAAADWATYDYMIQQVALYILPLVFLMHTMFMLFFVRLCQVAAQPGGAMLPTSLRSVMYLDIYGWLRRSKISKAGMDKMRGGFLDQAKANLSRACARRRGSPGKGSAGKEQPNLKRRSSVFLESMLGSKDKEFVSDEERRLSMVHGQTFPRHFGAENPTPLRPEDVETSVHPTEDPNGFTWAREEATSYLDIDEAEGGGTALLGVGPAGVIPQATPEAFSPKSFGPNRVPGAGVPNAVGEGEEWATGREAYDPGELPWYLFRSGAMLLAMCWFAGALWSVAQVMKVPDIPVSILPEEVSVAEDERSETEVAETTDGLGRGYQELGVGQRVIIKWPASSFQPWGISCDSTGTHFAISDEFQLYSASIAASVDGLRLTRFRPAPRCLPVEGQALRDITVFCEKLGWQPGATSQHPCKALVLHERGQRLAECDLFGQSDDAGSVAAAPEASTPAKVWNISTQWLRALDGYMREEVISAAMDPACGSERGSPEFRTNSSCVVVGTNHGRIVRLRKATRKAGELVPADALWNALGETVKPQLAEVWATSLLQTLPGGYLLALRDGRRSVHAMHMATRRIVGKWRLPDRPGNTWTALAGGSNHLFITSQNDAGSHAELWRFSLPPILKSAVTAAATTAPEFPDAAKASAQAVPAAMQTGRRAGLSAAPSSQQW